MDGGYWLKASRAGSEGDGSAPNESKTASNITILVVLPELPLPEPARGDGNLPVE
jgi:hypothetical protein